MSLFFKRRKARLIEQLGTIYISNISEGTAFLLQGVTKNDSKSKRYKFKIAEGLDPPLLYGVVPWGIQS